MTPITKDDNFVLIDKLHISKSIQLLILFTLAHNRSLKFSVVTFCASLVKIRPAKLNKRSTEAEQAGTAKNCRAILLKLGIRASCLDHHSKTSVSIGATGNEK